jgi:hypothetical protein
VKVGLDLGLSESFESVKTRCNQDEYLEYQRRLQTDKESTYGSSQYQPGSIAWSSNQRHCHCRIWMTVVTLEVMIDSPRETETESECKPGNEGCNDIEAEIGLVRQLESGMETVATNDVERSRPSPCPAGPRCDE